LIFGRNDALIPNKYFHPKEDLCQLVDKAKKELPQLHVRMIEDAGHFVNFEQAEEVNKVIEDFLKE
jgi:pimeloyl-ACP methyl ester carboxylesterase